MNQNNNVNNGMQNQNNVVQPTPMPANPQTNVQPTPMPASPQTNVQPTPVVNPQNNVVQPTQTVNPQNNVVNPNPNTNVVSPNQNVINTSKKKSGHILLFIVIILIAVFVYYLDDVLAYFNQNFTPVVENKVLDNASANLIDGYIKIDDLSAYIKLNGIKFSNVKKSVDNVVILSYVSDRNYATTNSLNISIIIYNSNKEQLFNEKFDIAGSVDASVNRQYKIKLDEKTYNDAYYVLITNNTEGNK